MRAHYIFEAVNTMDKYYDTDELLDHVFATVHQYLSVKMFKEFIKMNIY